MIQNQTKQHNRIQDYELLQDLGYGNFSKVQLVKRKADGKYFAMKNILINKLSQKQKQSSLNEIRILASINDPHIIKYEDSFYSIHQKSLCIVMQYAEGGDLQNKIIERRQMDRSHGFAQKIIWQVAYNILCGLKLLHQNNIIHRDLKCANIFFSKGIAKIGDLNISKISQNGMCETQTGTPYYTSPEIWKGKIYDSKCDIWSLGCILYQMASLKRPFNANDFSQLCQKVIAGKYDPIPQNYSNELNQLIKLCFVVDHNKRLSANQLLNNQKFKSVEIQIKNSILKKQKQNKQKQIFLFKLIQPIKFPENQKQLQKNLNIQLPHPEKIFQKKKTVNFFKEEENKKITVHTKNFTIKKKIIKSEKNITIVPSDKSIKLKNEPLVANINTFNKQKSLKENPLRKLKIKISLNQNLNEFDGLQQQTNSKRQQSLKKLQQSTNIQKATSNFKIRKNQPKSLKVIPLDKYQKQNKNPFNHRQKTSIYKN